MVTGSENGFHLGDPVKFCLSGMRYVGVFQEHRGPNDAHVLVRQQGEWETDLVVLVGVSCLRPLGDKVGIE